MVLKRGGGRHAFSARSKTRAIVGLYLCLIHQLDECLLMLAKRPPPLQTATPTPSMSPSAFYASWVVRDEKDGGEILKGSALELSLSSLTFTSLGFFFIFLFLKHDLTLCFSDWCLALLGTFITPPSPPLSNTHAHARTDTHTYAV